MATPAPKKPSTPAKRTPAKKPTKAAALKALGLSQEDLDTLKAVAAAREQAAAPWPEQTPEPVETIPEPVAPSQEIPNSLKTADERREDAGVKDTPLFIRNRQNCEVGIRLSRQKQGTPRLDLKPRGERGDIERLQAEDYGDPVLDRQLQLGVIEIITLAEARDAIEKQSINARQQVHPALAMLRNPLGEEYAPDSVRLAPEFNSQGVTVAKLDPRQMRGELTDTEVKRGAGLERVQAQQHVTAPVGGNQAILNDGFQRNDAAARDAIARRRDIHGPEGGGITRVVVEPTQRG